MATQIDQILMRLAELATASGQCPDLAVSLENHARKLEMPAPGSEGRVQELGTIRSLYSMGMGGWMDVVLQDKTASCRSTAQAWTPHYLQSLPDIAC